jgi:hypothetical protein
MKYIEQKEIARLIELRAKREKIDEELVPLEESIQDRLLNKARCAKGKHLVFLQVRERRNVPWKEKAMQFAKKLGLDPEKWAKRTLDHTKPSISYDLNAR